MNKYLFLLLFCCCLLSCKEQEQEYPMVNLPSSRTGIDFTNQLQESDSLNILDYLYFYNGGGVGVGDFDKDGLPDIYLSANQGSNKLFHNQGDLRFEDVTQQAGVAGNSSWNTGVTVADINNDGWLDILVSAVVGINDFTGHHELFINNGDLTFSERSADYGLDLQVYGTMVASLDYDLDGDLDLYFLNHAVHTQESFGRSQIRTKRDPKTGDRLMRNDGDRFTDVSEEAGIYGGPNGYGLGVAVSDFNQDGFPDLYIGNDFHEDDYYYLNNGDGTFKEALKDHFGHSSRFSMGNDVADINNDGRPDLISLDMLPPQEPVVKASEGDDAFQTLLLRTQQYGYNYQFSRNMLFLQQPDSSYAEVALQAGVAATDWSWSALFADLDQDGWQDLFISNGIPRRPNDLDFIRFLSNEQIQEQVNSSRLVDQQALDLMPAGMVSNYIYRGRKGLGFDDVSSVWTTNKKGVSGATALADLDGDGDLDLVINNLNEETSLIENQHNAGHYLKVGFQLENGNHFGYGARVIAFVDNEVLYRELNPHRGFQATSEAVVHFGLGTKERLDSLTVVFPNGQSKTWRDQQVDTTLIVRTSDAGKRLSGAEKSGTAFQLVDGNLGVDYVHTAQPYFDFTRQKLIPYGVSDRGQKAFGPISMEMDVPLFLSVDQKRISRFNMIRLGIHWLN
ncbi:CRTAC1 family protein [Aureitalea marina]|uniref:CRTAC1 family protein n=1 Tax=Aureitalea marina TaxID=930804 RepID=UPI00268CF420